MKKVDRGYIVILITGVSCIILAILIDYINLKVFKTCYNNDFKYDYCEYFKKNY